MYQRRLPDFRFSNWLGIDAYHQCGTKRREADTEGNKVNLILNMLGLGKLWNMQSEITRMLLYLWIWS